MQAVGKKLAVVEVCVGKGVARVRAGRRATGNQVNVRLSRNILNMHLRAIADICHFLGLNISHSNDTLNKEQNSTRSFGFFLKLS